MRIPPPSWPWGATAVAVAVVFLGPSTAWANPIVPPVAVVWPAAWILLVPIVAIEAVVAARVLRVKAVEAVRLSLAANLLSTAAGVPIGSCLISLPLILIGGNHVGDQTSLASELLFWASQVIPLYFVSVLTEGWLVRRIADKAVRPKVWRWAWLANGLTYALISAGLIVLCIRDVSGSK